jgi:hypothetical protein
MLEGNGLKPLYSTLVTTQPYLVPRLAIVQAKHHAMPCHCRKYAFAILKITFCGEEQGTSASKGEEFSFPTR